MNHSNRKILKFTFITILFLTIGNTNVWAGETKTEIQENLDYFFDFIPSTYEIKPDKEIILNIEHKTSDIENKNWKVRPVANNALISIYNPKTQEWIFTKNSWSKMPSLNSRIKVRINSHEEKINLKVQIKDLKTAETHETPGKTLWTLKAYQNYSNKLNESIKEWKKTKKPTEINQETTSQKPRMETQTKQINTLKNDKKMALINLGAFLSSGIVGFIRKNDKIPS
jgi:hypothetical protein